MLDAIVVGLLVAWVVNWYLLQIVFIGAAFALGLLVVLSVAAWRHGFRWFFTRRALRFYGWLVVGIISVIVLFYAEENWRGKRAWAALQREAAARGESLELSSVFPPPVPDDENFALAPGVPQSARLRRTGTGRDSHAVAMPDESNLPFFYMAEGARMSGRRPTGRSSKPPTWPPGRSSFAAIP